MADVYLAGDEVLGREVALKLLKDRYAENEEFVERFKREAKSAAALSSPYIVPVFDWGETENGTYYITMEYVPGGTLKERIMTTGALRPRAAVEVALQVAKAFESLPKASTSAPPSSTQPASRRRRVVPTLTIFAVLLTVVAVVGLGLWRDRGGGVLHALLERLPTEASQDAKRTPPVPKTVEVPTVKGMGEQAARERLTEADFKVEVERRDSPEEDSGKVIGQSLAGGKEEKRGSKVLLMVGEDPQVTKVPDLTGLPYSEAENKLKEAGYLLGGVEEATSDTVPAGLVMKQDPPPGTTLDPNSYVYLTDSVGPPTEGTGGTPSTQSVPSGEASGETASSEAASSEAAAVAAAVRGHYKAIGARNFEEAYTYFGPTLRSQQDEANWIAGEESSQIQSITINSLQVNEVSGNTATATVDFSSINKTVTARFHIVWILVKEGGEWKLDHQLSGQRTG